jgi:hypothetical protein
MPDLNVLTIKSAALLLWLSSPDQDNVAPPLLRHWDYPEFVDEEREAFKRGSRTARISSS